MFVDLGALRRENRGVFSASHAISQMQLWLRRKDHCKLISASVACSHRDAILTPPTSNSVANTATPAQPLVGILHFWDSALVALVTRSNCTRFEIFRTRYSFNT
jgi:hypothetical protein